jgi:putative spermidine/putrescine transport system ATP-binding protein
MSTAAVTGSDLRDSPRRDPRSGDTATGAPGLRLSGLGKVLGGRTVVDSLDLTVAEGELVCLLGPSGCGKTTTLRMIGGFITPDSGSVEIDGNPVTQLSPDRRPTAMVFQNYALWPHMTVAGNIAFGLRIAHLGRAEINRRVTDVLEMVNLTHHRDSYPARISGGEQQRAALARALVLRPRVLLLDEPLSNLDARLRVRVREDIRRIQQELGITTVLVTHDQDEALSISDRVAVMNGGRIEQVSGPRELYRRPRTRFVAEFVGAMNVLPARQVDGGGVLLGGSIVPVAELDGASGRDGVTDADSFEIGFRPEDVRLETAHTGQNPAGAAGRIVREIPRGAVTELVVEVGTAAIRALVSADLDPATAFPGGAVAVRIGRALVYRDGLVTGGEFS